jgi:hypothetical protein
MPGVRSLDPMVAERSGERGQREVNGSEIEAARYVRSAALP